LEKFKDVSEISYIKRIIIITQNYVYRTRSLEVDCAWKLRMTERHTAVVWRFHRSDTRILGSLRVPITPQTHPTMNPLSTFTSTVKCA